VRWEANAETLCARVPSLILQPLVENAIRHGIAPFARTGRLEISATRTANDLLLQVHDNGPGIPEARPGAGHDPVSSGSQSDPGMNVCLSRPFRLRNSRQSFWRKMLIFQTQVPDLILFNRFYPQSLIAIRWGNVAAEPNSFSAFPRSLRHPVAKSLASEC